MPKPLHKFNKFHAIHDSLDGSRLREIALVKLRGDGRLTGSQERWSAQQKEAAQGVHEEKQEDVSAYVLFWISSC